MAGGMGGRGWGGRKLQTRRLREGQPGRALARTRLSTGALGRQLCALGHARVGQCHLAPGNRRHFLRADRWLALEGGGY